MTGRSRWDLPPSPLQRWVARHAKSIRVFCVVGIVVSIALTALHLIHGDPAIQAIASLSGCGGFVASIAGLPSTQRQIRDHDSRT